MARLGAAHLASACAIVCCMLLGIVQFYSETNFKEMKLIQAAGKHATTSTLAQKQHSMSTLSPSPARLTYKPNSKSVGTVKQASIGTVKHAKIHGAASPSALRSKGNLKKPRSILSERCSRSCHCTSMQRSTGFRRKRKLIRSITTLATKRRWRRTMRTRIPKPISIPCAAQCMFMRAVR